MTDDTIRDKAIEVAKALRAQLIKENSEKASLTIPAVEGIEMEAFRDMVLIEMKRMEIQ